MSDKEYKIILPLALEGINKYGDLYDVSLCNDDNAKILIISSDDFEKMNIESICLDLYNKYGFLLGDGDYYFLNHNECKIFMNYIINNKTKLQISSEMIDNIVYLCEEAIKLNTGIGFDF